MTVVRGLIFGLAATLGFAGPATAQLKPEPPIGTRIPKPPEEFAVDESRTVVSQFAACAAKSHYALARDLILAVSDYYLPEKHRKVADSSCLTKAARGYQFGMVQLSMSNGIMRFAIADALVAKDLKAYDPTGISGAASLQPIRHNLEAVTPSGRLSKKELEEAMARDRAEVELMKYGECVVRADPRGSKRLLASKINSDEEAIYLRAMMPAFSSCLNIGQQFRASRTLLRGTVAFNFYRLAYAPRVTTPTRPSSR